jgi:hypothetical protein
MNAPQEKKSREQPADRKPDSDSKDVKPAAPREIGGRAGPEPTRFGDWEKDGRCIDF